MNSLYDKLYPPQRRPYVPIGGFDFPPQIVIGGGVAIFGSTRSGKTTLMELIKEGLLRFFRALVFDAKGDDLPVLRGIVGEDRVANLSVFDAKALAWDIAHDTQDSLFRRVLAYAFIPDSPGYPQGHFWNSNARNIFTGVQEGFQPTGVPALFEAALTHMGPESQGPSWDLLDLIIACSPDILPRILEKTELGRHVIKTVLTHRGIATDRVQDLVSTLASYLDPLLEVARAMRIHKNAGRTFSLLDFVGKKTHQTVIRVALDSLGAESWNPMLGNILRFLSRALLARPVNEERLDFLFFADELQEIAPVFPEVARFMATSRTKGCASIVATQHFQGLRDAFGNPTAHLAFTDICKTHVYLRSDSPEVAEHAAKLIGPVTYWRNSPSVNKSRGLSDTYGENDGSATTWKDRHEEFPGHVKRESITHSSGRQWSQNRSENSGSAYQLQRHVEPLFDYGDLLTMAPPSRETGMGCVVRSGNRKWHLRINPAWIENRSVQAIGVPDQRLDLNQLPFKPWTREEEARFMPTGNDDFFAGIEEKVKPKKETKKEPTKRRWKRRNLGEGLGIGVPGPAGRRR